MRTNKLVQKNVTSAQPQNSQQNGNIKEYYQKSEQNQSRKSMKESSISLLQSLKSVNGLSQNKIQMAKQKQQDKKLQPAYEQTLKRFKRMRGKAKSVSHINLNETTAISYSKTQSNIPNIQSIGKQKIQMLRSRLNQSKIKKQINNSSIQPQKTNGKLKKQQNKPKETKDENNKTKIRFIAERQHTVQDLQQDPQQNNRKQLQVQFRLTGSSTLKNRATSLPSIQNESNKVQQTAKKNSTNLQKNRTKTNEQKSKSSNKQVSMTNQQKKLEMSRIQFSLTNLKQKISQINNKNSLSVTSSRLTIHETKNNKKPNTIFDLSTMPVSLNKYKKMGQLNQSRISKKGKQDVSELNSLLNFNEQLGNKTQIYSQHHQIQASSNSPIHQKQLNKDTKIGENGSPNKRSEHLVKLTKKKQHLQQIVEDIQNQNNQKEEQLKQHKNKTKNIQINLLTKRQRINQLQSQINNFRQSEDQQIPQKQDKGRNYDKQINEGNQKKQQVSKLKKEKIEKEKKYSLQKDLLKSEIKQIQSQMKQQQNKFKLLKDEQQYIKTKQFEQKQLQLENKNKQITAQLQRKTSQLQLIIQKQKEKAKKYQQQLIQQKRKNQEITMELKKQQQMQQLLLKQLEKISKDRVIKKAKKQQQKNQQKLRLIQQIKQLEETQNKILMEYQRDTQSISSMYQAMRLKNIELENKIKEKTKLRENQQKKPQIQNVLREAQPQAAVAK